MAWSQNRWKLVLSMSVLAIGLSWAGWRWWKVRRIRKAMAEIREQMQAGRHANAVQSLTTLLAWKPDAHEARYLLGNCELAEGRPGRADVAWARVPPDSPFAIRAIQGRVQLRIERGRLAAAEDLIKNALRDPRLPASDLLLSLGPVYSLGGRLDEAERLIEANWKHLNGLGAGASPGAITLVRLHIEMELEKNSDKARRSFLDESARSAPDDDRIWLGKAILATSVRSFDEAARLLDACLLRRPDDGAVWRARLNLAMATGRVSEAREALRHVPADESTPAQVQRVAAWLAARRGEIESERRELERLILSDPCDGSALDRLALLSAQAGQPGRVAELRSKKTELAQLRARYQKLYRRNQPLRDAAEMGHLAEKLGRWFEAKVFLSVATMMDPQRDDLKSDLIRVNRRGETVRESGRTLADLLAGELDAEIRSSPASSPPSGTSSPMPASEADSLRRSSPLVTPQAWRKLGCAGAGAGVILAYVRLDARTKL
jgi:predicted Zn-dependent protease